MSETPTDKYRFCNHHHEIGEYHAIIDLGDGMFVANKAAIPLLRALSEAGLRTRTHHYDGGTHGFVSILLGDGTTAEIREVDEIHADRTKYNGKKELLITWNKELNEVILNIMDCTICGKEFEYKDTYGDAECPHCNQKYGYDEGQQLELTENQVATLLTINKKAEENGYTK